MNRRIACCQVLPRLRGLSRLATLGIWSGIAWVAWLALAATATAQTTRHTPLPPPGNAATQLPSTPTIGRPETKIDQAGVARPSEFSLADLPAQARNRLWGPNQPRELKWIVSGLLAMSGMWLALQLFRSGRRAPGELSEDVLEWLGSIPVDQRHRLLLVRLGSQVLLLSQSEGQLQTLAAVSDPGEVQALLVTCRHGAGGPSPAWAARGATLSREVRRRINELS